MSPKRLKLNWGRYETFVDDLKSRFNVNHIKIVSKCFQVQYFNITATKKRVVEWLVFVYIPFLFLHISPSICDVLCVILLYLFIVQ